MPRLRPVFATTRVLLCVVTILLAGLQPLQAGQPLGWEKTRGDSTVYLLGSIHLLPEEAGPLPERVASLYERADTLVMELDLAALDPLEFQQLVVSLGQAPEGRRLQDYMDDETWTQARALAAEADLGLELFTGAKPWLAALTVTQLRLLQLGYSPELGLEHQLTEWAQRDDKPVSGLETAEDQLRVFDGLDEQAQVALLIESLEEAARIEEEMARLVRAWQQGDAEFLVSDLLGAMRASEALYEAVVVDRNRAWLDDIEALLAKPGTHLVVVGALHLVGEHSVVRLLADRGVELNPL